MNTMLINAVHQAADHIEANPEAYKFVEFLRPKSLAHPACAIAWIYYFYTRGPITKFITSTNWYDHSTFSIDLTSKDDVKGESLFYKRMGALNVHENSWKSDAGVCAKSLRNYATKYLVTE